MRALTKLTVKSVGLDKKTLSDMIRENGPSQVLSVVGRVFGAESKTGDLGPYVKFSGEFAARRPDVPNEEFRSKILILPAVAEMVLVSSCGGVKAQYEEPVSVALTIGIEENTDPRSCDSNPYRYTTDTPFTPPEDDFIASLWGELDNIALPAPKAVEKKTSGKRK